METVFGIMAVLFLAFFIMSKVSSDPIFVFNRTTMWVITDSMDQTIPPKTYILVEKITAEEAEEQDIIVFRSTDPKIYGQYNTHRVIHKEGNTFITKGDNNSADDGEYSAKAENIVGRYVKTLPVMTFIGRVVMKPVGFAVLIVLFTATMALCFFPDLKEAVKLKKQEDEEEIRLEKRRLIDEEIRRLKESDGADAELKDDKKDKT